MTAIAAIAPLTATPPAVVAPAVADVLSAPAVGAGDFAALLRNGLANMDAKVANADRMVARFALDDNVPIHHVTIALEEARLSVELAMQVRQRVVESYKELMNMQL